MGYSEQTALERQEWPCIHLAHHEPDIIIIVIIVIKALLWKWSNW